MSFYPANQNSNVFNADDFISPDEIKETTNSNNSDVNMDEYMKKSGSVMSGTLQVPQIFISGANSLAYTTTEKNSLNNNTNKLQNVIKTATHTEISDLKCDAIQFANAKQNQAFTDADKTQININKGKLDGVSNSVGDIITSSKTLNIKDSPEIDVVNTQSSNTKFDGALSFFRTGSVYRKWWVGTIGDTINPNNTFNICVNGNHPEPESVLQLDHNGKLGIKELEINHQKSNAFTDNDKMNISLSGYWVDRCIFNEFDTTFLFPVTFASQSSSGEITISNQSITYNDDTQQTTAFLQDHKDKLELITVETNERFRLTSNNNGNDKIEVNSESLYLRKGGVSYGEIGNLTNTNELEIKGENKLKLTSGNNGNEKLEINSETLFLKKLAVSYGEIGLKDTSTDMNIISYGRDIILETVGNGFNIIINSDALNLNGSLVMNNETQNYSFTDTRKENLDYLMSGKIRHKHNFGWELLNFTPNNYTSYKGEKFYNVLTPVSEFSNGDRWIGGTKYISLKFNIRFKILNSLIRRFETRFQVFRQYDPSNPNQALIKEESLYTGYYHYGNGMDFHHTLTLNDTFDMLVEDGDLILLQTKYDMAMNTTPGYTMNCRVFITEY